MNCVKIVNLIYELRQKIVNLIYELRQKIVN